MSRTYQGYTQANQSPVMEEETETETAEEHDIEAGHVVLRSTSRPSNASAKTQGKRKVSWDTGGHASEMNPLRPNIRREDESYEQDASDDEVPQSFMIEASRSPRKPPPSSASSSNKGKGKVRSQPLHSISARSLARESYPSHPISIPPRPSELDVDVPPQPHPNQSSSQKPLRGLDAYERALWNWVNVYNLDAFLQEVYLYYEGKGIYSIALARGLNILSALLGVFCISRLTVSMQHSRVCDRLLDILVRVYRL